MNATDQFRKWLQTNPGPWFIGELRIEPGYFLLHRKDSPQDPLRQLGSWEEFLGVVRGNDLQSFRPLRGAPGLSRGWKWGPLPLETLVLALRWAYPTALASWSFWKEGRLELTDASTVARRQTGLYETLKELTQEDWQRAVFRICHKECLRIPLWSPATQEVHETETTLPLLCPEPCHYLLTRARGDQGPKPP